MLEWSDDEEDGIAIQEDVDIRLTVQRLSFNFWTRDDFEVGCMHRFTQLVEYIYCTFHMTHPALSLCRTKPKMAP